jgi:excisionase family DNA binding protein
MSKTLPMPAPRDGLATVGQASQFLETCRTTVYAMMRDDELAYVKIRNARRIPWAELHKLAAGS